MRTGIVLAAMLIVPEVVFSATIIVPDDQPTIQAGMDAAVNGDTVLVKPGTYVENIDFKGKAITVSSTQGPDATVINGESPANPDTGSTVSFKSGEGKNSVLEGFTLTGGTGTLKIADYYGGNIFCDGSSPTIRNNVIMTAAQDYTLLGGGIACIHQASPDIQNNTIKGHAALYGSGIYCYDQSSPTISGNDIVDNWSDTFIGDGGGIFCVSGCDPTIWGNSISGNHASAGAAISIADQCNPIVAENLICMNRAHWTGSGIACYNHAKATILNNRIIDNDAKSWAGSGGGIYCTGFCTLVLTNNFIAGNAVASYGGGIYCSESVLTLVNNTIVDNYTGDWTGKSGGAIHCTSNSTVDIANTILWDNDKYLVKNQIYIGDSSNPSTVNIHHSDVMGGNVIPYVNCAPRCVLNWGSGMIDADPLFVDQAKADIHLTYPSPCKNTGDNTAVTELFDFESDPRIAYGTVDLGADEFHTHLYYTGDAAPGGTVEMKFVDLPGASPVGFWVAFNALETPIPGAYGDWWLLPPMVGPISLGSIPANGVYILSGTIPASPPGPYTLYLQAIMGTPLKLTNPCTMDVQ